MSPAAGVVIVCAAAVLEMNSICTPSSVPAVGTASVSAAAVAFVMMYLAGA